MSPRVLFEQDLETLKNKVSEMGEHAEISYDRMAYGIRENKEDILKTLLNTDHTMVDMQRSIEAMCLSLLTRQQPVARDMRLVSAALKVVPDIERIGDHVADIVELYLRMGNMNPEGKQEHLLLEMMEEAKEMIHNSVEAFVEGDEANARKVVEHDDVVDDLFNEVKTGMMQAIREQSLDADRVVDYLMMAKYLEKVGDHAVNIAEWAIFRMTGDMEGARLYEDSIISVTMQSPNLQNCSCGAFLLLIEACSPKNYCHMLLRMLAFDEHPARFMALHRYNFT